MTRLYEVEMNSKGMPNFATAREVQERKRGKWYKPTGMMPPEHFGRHRCSECEEFALHDWKHHREQLTNFCPNCGADMRGETNAENMDEDQ